jgi:hypothetical protein
MKRTVTILASLALVFVIAAPAAAITSPTTEGAIAGRCAGGGGGSIFLSFEPDLASQFPGATILGFSNEFAGHAVVFDDVGANARIAVDLTFSATDDFGLTLWQSSTAHILVQGFASEIGPPGGVDTAEFPVLLTVEMVPVGFSAPTVSLLWRVIVIVAWNDGSIGSIGCGVGVPDIPTVIGSGGS